MAKLTLTDGTIFEGTTEEIFAITERFNGVKSDEPIAETLTHNGVEYTKVDRKAQVGDFVLVTHENGNCFKPRKLYGPCFVEVDGVLNVNADSSTGIGSYEVSRVYNEYYGRTAETVLVYTPKVDPKEAVFTQVGRKPNEYRKGDIVRVFKADGKSFVGFVTIGGTLAGGDCFEITLEDSRTRGVFSDEGDAAEPIAFVESRLDRN